MLLWQIFVAKNNNTFAGLHVNFPMLQWNKRMFVWSWPVLDAQVGETDHNLSQVVGRFLSFSKRDPRLFYEIRRNKSVTKDKVLNIMSVDVLLPKLTGMEFAFFLRWIILLCVISCSAILFISHKRYDFRGEKKILIIKCVFRFFLQLLSETFPTLRRIQRSVIKIVHRPSCKVGVNSYQIIFQIEFRRKILRKILK
jgi:hypothetical protein